MGIVNVTPDSFADGGRYFDPAVAVRQARVLAAEGADLLDVGAESTRPGSAPVPASEEWARLLPVLKRLLDGPPCPVSVDTSKPEVAEAALTLGAHMVNDVTALAGGPDLARVCAAHGAGLAVMHMRGHRARCRPIRSMTISSAKSGAVSRPRSPLRRRPV
jgi:dihydropteroate synthase